MKECGIDALELLYAPVWFAVAVAAGTLVAIIAASVVLRLGRKPKRRGPDIRCTTNE